MQLQAPNYMAPTSQLRKRPASVRGVASSKRPKESAGNGSGKRASSANLRWYESFAGGLAPHYQAYMDKEWGVPIYAAGCRCDNKLFEMISLEGAQAGLSWDTILKKRQAYRRDFEGFDIAKVADFGPTRVKALLASPGEGAEVIVRNRAKIESVVRNARLCLEVAKEHGSLCKFLWSFVGGRPIENCWQQKSDIPADTEAARKMSKELKRLGFGFVGPKVCYSFMQSVGMVNDHPAGTPQWHRVRQIVAKRFESR